MRVRARCAMSAQNGVQLGDAMTGENVEVHTTQGTIMNNAPGTASISLYCQEGTADKEYRASIQPRGDGWVVNTQHGRRGGTLTPGTKTPEPVSFEKAEKIYRSLCREKAAKGYVATEGGTAFQNTEFAARDTGIRPQLLNPIDNVALHVLCGDPAWVAQPKHDGQRRLVVVEGGQAFGINRKGLTVALPLHLADVLQNYLRDPAGRTILDGELMGDVYAPFDVLAHAGRDLTDLSYTSRLRGLEALLGHLPPDAPVVRPQTARTSTEKRALLDQLRAANAEGIVLKDADAVYRCGVSTSACKFKFVASLTVEAGESKEGKRSVGMYVIGDDGKRVFVGYCTVPPNAQIPTSGTLCEISYLYCYRGGSLFQPVWKGLRDDLDQADSYSSLQFKREEAVAAFA